MKNIRLLPVALLAFAGPAWASSQDSADSAWQRARLVHQVEHDLEGAVQAYQALLARTDLTSDLRAQAQLELGRALVDLGRAEQAIAAVQSLVEASGTVGDRARALTAEAQLDPARSQALEEQARAAADRMRSMFARMVPSESGYTHSAFFNSAADDMVWLKEAAVPTVRGEVQRLAERLEKLQVKGLVGFGGLNLDEVPVALSGGGDREKVIDFSRKELAAWMGILWVGGSESACQALQEYLHGQDAELRMAVAVGMRHCYSLNERTEALFLDAVLDRGGDGQVGVTALRQGRVSFRNRGVFAGLPDPLVIFDSPHAAVQVEMLEWIAGMDLLEDRELIGRLIPIAERCLNSTHPGLNRKVARLLGAHGLAHPGLHRLDIQARLAGFGEEMQQVRYYPNTEWSAELEAGWLKVLESAPDQSGANPLMYTGNRGVAESIQFLTGGWRQGLAVMQLAFEKGYLRMGSFLEWCNLSLTATQAVELAATHADKDWAWSLLQSLPEGPVDVAVLPRLREVWNGVQSGADQTTDHRKPQLLTLAARIDDPQAAAQILAWHTPALYESTVYSLLRQNYQSDSAWSREALGKALYLPANDSRGVSKARLDIVQRLVEIGDGSALRDADRWKDLAIEGQLPQANWGFYLNKGSRVLQCLVAYKDLAPYSRIPLEQNLAIWRSAFEQLNWSDDDARLLLMLAHPEYPSTEYQQAMVAVAADFLSTQLELCRTGQDLNNPSGIQAAMLLICTYLERKPEGVDLPALQGMDQVLAGWITCGQAETVRGLLRREYPKSYLEALGAAARRVSGAEATYAEAIGFRTRNKLPLDRADVQRFLTVSEAHASDSRGEIRNQPTQAQSAWEVEGQDRGLKLDAVWLISGLREYAPDAQWDWILDQAGSASPSIRAACMRSLGTFLDVEAVPTILKGLGDSDNHVQTEARAALDKIRFYHDEKQRWQRFFEGQGLDAQNAAEALVRQAQAGQPKAQRLLAIRSLGKLADPQALPFLIEWNKESDGEITGACQKAIESILKSE
ncbi:MAG: hypothetical protein R3F33_05885 [Planctomycetota bacterium]